VAQLVAPPDAGAQDRYAMLAPLAAVLLFLAAIVSAFWYLRLEEIDREQEAVAATSNTRSSACACGCWNARNS
jgi:hypothetical protein